MTGGTYDYAVLGAGVSGLVLARRLAQDPARLASVLLVDGARDDDVLRTLSFWAQGPTAVDDLVRHRYRAMELCTPGDAPVPLELRGLEYRTLFFAELQRVVKAALGAASAHAVVDGRASALRDAGDHVELAVGGQTFRARWVFDSRFRLADLRVDPRRYHDERQHFRGWVVRTPTPRFAGLVPRFMDFRTALAPGRAFFYVLPFADDTALVELVTLDAVDAAPELTRYLDAHLGVRDFAVVDEEAGVSPMTEQPFPRRLGPRVRAIGIAGGRAKATTGYALARILDDTEAIVGSLARRGHPFATPRARGIFRWMDAALLEVWATRPAVLPAVFRRMFARNRADDVLRFLDERASLGAIVRLARTLPMGVFVPAAARCALRRLGLGGRPPPGLPPPESPPSAELDPPR